MPRSCAYPEPMRRYATITGSFPQATKNSQAASRFRTIQVCPKETGRQFVINCQPQGRNPPCARHETTGVHQPAWWRGGRVAARGARAAGRADAAHRCAVRDAGEIERAVAAFARSPNGGLIVTSGAGSVLHRELIIALAARYKLPAVYYRRYFVTSGGLISYGFDLVDQYRHAAGYVDRSSRVRSQPTSRCKHRLGTSS
jgi:hypothetical protein